MPAVLPWGDDVDVIVLKGGQIFANDITDCILLFFVRECSEVVCCSFSDAVDVVEPDYVLHLLVSGFHF